YGFQSWHAGRPSSGTLYGCYPKPSFLKLSQKPQIVRPEMADIIDAVFAYGDALRSHPKGETAETRGVVAAVLEDRGMDHAGTHHLQPTPPLAHATPLAAAADAIHIDFDARLGEREVARPDTYLPVFAEHAPRESDDGALQIGHGHVAADSQSFHLVELD